MGLSSDALAALNEAASAFYEAALASPAGARARTYLAGRGLSPETIRRWRLGFAPPGGLDLARHLGKMGHGEAVLLEAGLLRAGSRGAVDLLRDRVALPIIGADDRRIMGFGSRRLDDSDPSVPKYLNSPETVLFRKSELLYGMPNLAEAESVGEVLVVEGNIDMLALHDAGFHNVVAAAGTALTPEHLALIAERVRRVTLLLDGDEAGRKAAGRALRLPGAGALDMGVVTIIGAKDPAELLERGGPGAMRAMLATRTPRWDALWSGIGEAHPGDEAEDRIVRKEALVELIVGQAASRAESDALFARAERELGLASGLLVAEYGSRVIGDLAPAEELLLVALAAEWERRRPYVEWLELGAGARAQIARWTATGGPVLGAALRRRSTLEHAESERIWGFELRKRRPALQAALSRAVAAGPAERERAAELMRLIAGMAKA